MMIPLCAQPGGFLEQIRVFDSMSRTNSAGITQFLEDAGLLPPAVIDMLTAIPD
jgi:hypothetical protein